MAVWATCTLYFLPLQVDAHKPEDQQVQERECMHVHGSSSSNCASTGVAPATVPATVPPPTGRAHRNEREGGCMRARGKAGARKDGWVHGRVGGWVHVQRQQEHQGGTGSNDGSGNGGSGDTMWPPSPSSLPPPFYYLFILVIYLVIFTCR